MSKTYELWDSASRNLVDSFASETEALSYVRAYAAQYGHAFPASWVLLWDDDDADEAGQIAEGIALLVRAGLLATTQIDQHEVSKRRVV